MTELNHLALTPLAFLLREVPENETNSFRVDSVEGSWRFNLGDT